MKIIPSFAKDEVLAEQLKLVTGSYLISAISFLMVCAVVAYITFTATNDYRVIVWFSVLTALYLGWVLRDLGQRKVTELSPRENAKREVVKALIANIVFCYLPIIFINEAYPPLVIVSIAIATGCLLYTSDAADE